MEQGDLVDLIGNETYWVYGGYGGAGTSLVCKIFNKPGMDRGGQIDLLCDMQSNHPRAYTHCHKVHPVKLLDGTPKVH